LALPLIALQYHEVRVYVNLEELNKLIVWSGPNAPTLNSGSYAMYGNGSLLVDYVYLDSEERRRFAQVGHEYLIEQLQYPADFALNGTSGTTLPQRLQLNFNHPCKEIIWAHRLGAYNGTSLNKFLCYSNVQEGWDDALLYAAQNLVAGMFNSTSATANPTAVTNGTTNVISLATTLPIAGDITLTPGYGLGTSQFVTPLSTGSNTSAGGVTQPAATVQSTIIDVVGVNVINNTGVALTAPLQLGWLDSTATLIATNPTGYYLSSFLGNSAVTLTLVVTGTLAAPVVTVASVSVSNHRLTLRDCSIPVNQDGSSGSSTWNDTRNNTNTNTGNPWDVAVVQLSNYGCRLDGAGNIVKSGNIVLNGHDRFSWREGSYFNYVQPWQYHTHTPADGINVYSFGLHPEQHQPSGTCNFSRIDTAILNYVVWDPLRNPAIIGSIVPQLNLVSNTKVYVLATNYNVLRIMSGMGGLAYSN